MSTLTIMRERVAQETRRKAYADVGTVYQNAINDAINTAIDSYVDERAWFNETRSSTFTTVADQEFYTAADDADIGRIIKIDYVKLQVGDSVFDLMPDFPSEIESAANNATATGQPGWWVFYDESIRLYPVPAEAWTVRIAGTYKIAAPATADEASNPWMVEAERLIRCRAKYELALHVLRDTELAQLMGTSVTEALEQMRRRTNKLTQRDNGRVRPMDF